MLQVLHSCSHVQSVQICELATPPDLHRAAEHTYMLSEVEIVYLLLSLQAGLSFVFTLVLLPGLHLA